MEEFGNILVGVTSRNRNPEEDVKLIAQCFIGLVDRLMGLEANINRLLEVVRLIALTEGSSFREGFAGCCIV